MRFEQFISKTKEQALIESTDTDQKNYEHHMAESRRHEDAWKSHHDARSELIKKHDAYKVDKDEHGNFKGSRIHFDSPADMQKHKEHQENASASYDQMEHHRNAANKLRVKLQKAKIGQ